MSSSIVNFLLVFSFLASAYTTIFLMMGSGPLMYCSSVLARVERIMSSLTSTSMTNSCICIWISVES